MRITDILTNYDNYNYSAMFMEDFDELEQELNDLIEEIEEVSGFFCNLNDVMENFNPEYCVYAMEEFDVLFYGVGPLDLAKKLYAGKFSPWDCFFSFDDVFGVYSGTHVQDFPEMDILNDTIEEIKSIANALIDFINGEFFIGLDGVDGIEGDILREFNEWLNERRDEGLHEDDNAYSAAVLAQM